MTCKYRFNILEAVEQPVKEFFNYLKPLGITAGKCVCCHIAFFRSFDIMSFFMAYGYNAIMSCKCRFDVLEAVDQPMKEFFNDLKPIGIIAGKCVWSHNTNFISFDIKSFFMAYGYNAIMTCN